MVPCNSVVRYDTMPVDKTNDGYDSDISCIEASVQYLLKKRGGWRGMEGKTPSMRCIECSICPYMSIYRNFSVRHPTLESTHKDRSCMRSPFHDLDLWGQIDDRTTENVHLLVGEKTHIETDRISDLHSII